MQIVDVKTYIVSLGFRNAIFVEVETDEGITGVAETVMKRKTRTIDQSIRELKSYLVGKDPTDIEMHWESMYRDSFWVGGPMHATPISVIDCALWDILAKKCGLPVYKILGGPTRKLIPSYCHCPAGSSPEEFAAGIRACSNRGFRAAKTTLPLYYGGKDTNSTIENGSSYSGFPGQRRKCRETELFDPQVFSRIREFFVAAREAGGGDFGLALDCHGRLNAKSAIHLCRELEGLNLLFVEEPVPPENPQALRIVRENTTIPIAAGERWATIHGVREFVEMQAVDILQCDIVNCGGITGMKKIAALAEAHYISLAPHNPNGPVATTIAVHFAAAIPNFLILETIGSVEDKTLFEILTKHHATAEEGYFELPEDRPGFGVELMKASFADYPYFPHTGLR